MSFAKGYKASKKGPIGAIAVIADDKEQKKEFSNRRDEEVKSYEERRNIDLDYKNKALELDAKFEKKQHRREQSRERAKKAKEKLSGSHNISVKRNTTNTLVSGARLSNR